MAQKILQQSREAENALADALVRFELNSAWLGDKHDFFADLRGGFPKNAN